MTRPTAIVAEDEGSQRQALVRLLHEQWPDLAIVAECEDGISSLEALQMHKPAVAFLDIRMPGMSGLQIAAQLNADTQVVFTTAYSEHAVQAFEHGAVDYLLKPVAPERLCMTLARVQERIKSGRRGDVGGAIATLRARAQALPSRPMHWISVSIGNIVRMIPLEEILFFQSSERYTRVVSRQGEAIIRTGLKELLAALDPDVFWQVHRSVIVRVAAVRAMHARGGERFELELTGTADRVPVSVAFKGRFKGM
ncbi:MAG TPA: LytTR family DNA-binding domain-containing protein [Steroidobacteraceae bacterium]